MKHVQTCLSAIKDRHSSFHGGPVKLVHACLCAENTLKRRFNRRGGGVKQVQVCLSASKDGESSFHYGRNPVKLVQACLCAGNITKKAFFTTEEVLLSSCKPFNVLITAENVL